MDCGLWIVQRSVIVDGAGWENATLGVFATPKSAVVKRGQGGSLAVKSPKMHQNAPRCSKAGESTHCSSPVQDLLAAGAGQPQRLDRQCASATPTANGRSVPALPGELRIYCTSPPFISQDVRLSKLMVFQSCARCFKECGCLLAFRISYCRTVVYQ